MQVRVLVFAIFCSLPVFAKFRFAGQDSCLVLEGEHAKLSLLSNIDDFSGTLKLPEDTPDNHDFIQGDAHITFKQGILQRGEHKTSFSGVLGDEAVSKARKKKSFRLQGRQELNFGDIEVTEKINIQGKANKLLGRPRLTQTVTLEDAEAELRLSLQNKLTQSIELNGGSVILDGDLSLKDQTSFLGEGVVDINGFTLRFAGNKGTPHTSHLIFLNANDIELNGYTELSGTWTFTGNGGTSTLNGQGNVLDITSGGSIEIGENHILYVSNIDIKGLGANGGTFQIHDTGEMRVSTTAFELDGNFTCTEGKVSIISPDCKLIVKDNDFWIPAAPSGTLEIDGVVFNYQAVGNAQTYPPPFFPMGGSLSIINGGSITSPDFEIFKGAHNFSLSTGQGENQLTGGVDMTSKTIVRFVNEAPPARKSMIFNANNFTVRYSIANPGSMILDEGVDLLTKNIKVDNLDFTKMDLQGTGTAKATLTFGDGVVINMGESVTLEDDPWHFEGDSTIEGNNYDLVLKGSNRLTVDTGKVLTLHNVHLVVDTVDGLACLDDASTVILNNCRIKMSGGGLTLSKGNLKIGGFALFEDTGNVPDTEKFSFESKGKLTILSGAVLKISRGVIFRYDPDISDDGADQSIERRHLELTDAGSTISLKNCFWEIGAMGMALDHGVLSINQKVETRFDAGAELELGTALKTTVAAGGIFEVDGPVIYNATTAP